MKLSTICYQLLATSLVTESLFVTALRGAKQQKRSLASQKTYNYGQNLTADGIHDSYHGGVATFLDVTKISGMTMSLAVLQLYPGGVRELHWHPKATEWGFVTEGTCRISLMDNDGHYDNLEVSVGGIWNFPQSWGHTIQGVDPKVGCKMILFFNDPELPTYNDLGISEILSGFSSDVVAENTNTSEDIVKTFYNGTIVVNQGPMPTADDDFPVSQNPLTESPIINILDGTCSSYGTGGYIYEVKSNSFPAANAMSGGLISMNPNTLRDIHWHPNADELHYVLQGKLRVSILGIGGAKDTFVIEAGGAGFVPKGFAHYFEAIDNDQDTQVLLAFNSPSWQTQELSTWLAVTPRYLAAASLNVPVDALKGFPTSTEYFIGDSAVQCPASPTLPECYGC